MRGPNSSRHIIQVMSKLVIGLVTLSLTMCSPGPSASPSLTPTPPTTSRETSPPAPGNISANGVLLPAHRVELSFGSAGRIGSLAVEIGEHVQAGQALARMETSEMQLQVDKAQADLIVAQADYNLAVSNITVKQKTAALERIEARLALESLHQNAGTVRAETLQEIVQASKAVEEAQYQLYSYIMPGDLAGLESLEALAGAKEKLDQARADFEPYLQVSSGDRTRRDLKENLDRAQGDYNAALRRLELEASLAEAEARLEKARQDYEKRQGGPDPAELALAEARLDLTQALWDRTGSESSAHEQMALAQARLEAARLELKIAQTQLGGMTLRAPVEGVISMVGIEGGEWVAPGDQAFVLLDPSRWLVETKNVGELQIGRVEIGQEARVWVNAFRSETLNGRVVGISPQAVVQQGDTTYTLIIALEPTGLNLRSGMTARVEILT